MNGLAAVSSSFNTNRNSRLLWVNTIPRRASIVYIKRSPLRCRWLEVADVQAGGLEENLPGDPSFGFSEFGERFRVSSSEFRVRWKVLSFGDCGDLNLELETLNSRPLVEL